MAKDRIEGLISTLHERLGGDDTSPQQEQMFMQLRGQLTEWQGEAPPDNEMIGTAELLLEDLEENHPRAALILRDIVAILRNAGF